MFLVDPLLTTSIDLLPTPLPQTPHGHLAAFCILHYLLPFSTYHNLGFTDIYSHTSILRVILSFMPLSLLIRLSLVSAITIKSSSYNNCRGKANLNSLVKASLTITNSNGLNAEPWCIPTFTSKQLHTRTHPFYSPLGFCPDNLGNLAPER